MRIALADVVRPLIDRGALAGAVMLVASKNEILALESVGLAAIAANQAMLADALFWIASISELTVSVSRNAHPATPVSAH